MNIKELKECCQQLFSKRSQFMSLQQELAENFYPQRADFTFRREIGDEYASNLMTSYPIQVRRELGDQIGVMLRPTEKKWFHIALTDEDRETLEAKRWLEYARSIQRKAMYDRRAMFEKATKEGDHDFATFGQCILGVRLGRNRNHLLYRSYHLRDVAWMENEDGQICLTVRKWKPTRRELKRLFKNVHQNVTNKADKDPFGEIECYHIIIESDMYDKDAKGKPYISIYLDIENDHIMEELPVYNSEYVIPRWQTVSGSQYAYSPAAIAGLPDARMIQAMTYTLLEAGEKAVNPPLIATQDAIRGDISIYAGGITWADMDYDERLGAALRPITQDSRQIPLGMEMAANVQAMIAQAFFLNKLTLPQRAPEMTAYEVGQRIQEYIRGAIPIFAPMEPEYNGALCEKTFEVLMRAGAFGPIDLMPDELSTAEYTFKFESPLHDAVEQQKGQTFLEGQTILAEAAAHDPSVPIIMDAKVALRDVLSGIGTPAAWIRPEQEVIKIERQQAQQAQAQNTLAAMEQGSNVAKNLSEVEAAIA